MQWKAQERKSTDTRQWRDGLRLRRHAAAEGFAARNQSQPRTTSRGFIDGCTHDDMSHGWGIRPFAAAFHVRKLIAQGRDIALEQTERNPLHELVGHPRAGAMGKDEARLRC